MKETKPNRPWRRILIGTLAAFVILGGVMSSLFLGRWTRWIEVVPAEIEQVFASALLEAGQGPAYIEIADNQEVVIHREQEAASPKGFKSLILLAWSPGDEKVLRVEYPRWFVRLKTFSFVNLGTMIAAVRQDWDHLDLSISYNDLKKRGPGLLLDHQAKNGARILLWTTLKGDF